MFGKYNLGLCLLSVASAVSLMSSVAAAQTYDWTLTGSITGTGMLTLGAPDAGGFDIATFTGEIDGVSIALLGGNPGIGGAQAPECCGYETTYDNILFPTNSPLIDNNGIFAANADQSLYGNLYSNSPTDYEYDYFTGGHAYFVDGLSFSILPAQPVPEPASAVLLLAGMIGLAAWRHRTAVKSIVV